jgi:hypothetical protein
MVNVIYDRSKIDQFLYSVHFQGVYLKNQFFTKMTAFEVLLFLLSLTNYKMNISMKRNK